MSRPRKLAHSANIAKFKAHFGRYLRLVRAGEEVTVMDRNVPVALLTPIAEAPAVEYVNPTPVGTWTEVEKLLRKNDQEITPTKLKKSVLEYLREDRGDR